MSNIPVHSEPNVHSGPYTHKSCESGQQHVTAATALIYPCDAVILSMQPARLVQGR
jgi:hypothetical protein